MRQAQAVRSATCFSCVAPRSLRVFASAGMFHVLDGASHPRSPCLRRDVRHASRYIYQLLASRATPVGKNNNGSSALSADAVALQTKADEFGVAVTMVVLGGVASAMLKLTGTYCGSDSEPPIQPAHVPTSVLPAGSVLVNPVAPGAQPPGRQTTTPDPSRGKPCQRSAHSSAGRSQTATPASGSLNPMPGRTAG
jgi:hypothetical protein